MPALTVFARVRDVSLNIVDGSAQLTLPLNVAFDNSGTAVNDGPNAYIAAPNLASVEALNAAIKSQVVCWVNNTYGKTINSSSVILLSGAIPLPLL